MNAKQWYQRRVHGHLTTIHTKPGIHTTQTIIIIMGRNITQTIISRTRKSEILEVIVIVTEIVSD
eukprot:TRINITY_DN478_c0_g1_i1.p1 TRINITY_DN478_c0_g1~~TRINITY_DN478_c0_g1_i1.p1  ORF type:complete len:65 (+),score=9.99 TRINITY_DN478_c0_g1_i1:20-214(+)